MMLFLLYSVLFLGLLIYLGLGLALFFCPKDLRKYTLILSPFVGYSYLTLLGWYGYRLDLPGTDAYALPILLLPLVFFGIAWWQYKKQQEKIVLWEKEQLVSLGIGVIVFILLSLPMLISSADLTSVSIFNNDIADTASVAKFLREFKRTDTTGFLGQSNMFQQVADSIIFGSSIVTAFSSSVFSLATYQVQNISVHIFFALGVLVVFAVSREIFHYNKAAAYSVAGLYGLSPMMYYTLYNGFLTQTITMGLALCLWLLNNIAVVRCKSIKEYLSYLPLVVLFTWAVGNTYPHIIVFIYTPIFIYVLSLGVIRKSKGIILNWSLFILLALGALTMLSPFRAKEIVLVLFQRATIEAGWYFPVFLLDTLFGFTTNHPDLTSHSLSTRIGISLPLGMLVFAGLVKAYKKETCTFVLAASSLFVIVAGYVVLCVLGEGEQGWGGYKSFKFISFYMPFFLMSSLLLFKDMRIDFKEKRTLILPIIMLLLIGMNINSISYSIKTMISEHKVVTADLAGLEKIEQDSRVKSINILGKDWWEILWAINFLMRKQLYFETTTYAGRTASELKGDWDLMKYKDGQTELEAADEVIPVNSTYYLQRRVQGGTGRW